MAADRKTHGAFSRFAKNMRDPEVENCAGIEEEVTIVNRLGLHARPAAGIVSIASKFDAALTLRRADGKAENADCRSVLSLLMLAAPCGSRLIMRAEGREAAAAAGEMRKFFAGGFDGDDDK